jgi:hypothetical protein
LFGHLQQAHPEQMQFLEMTLKKIEDGGKSKRSEEKLIKNSRRK